ncbi:MAG: DUF2807 domain-containing protein [Bergeyella sp.]|nr:DUF2807 domain-containing protein [Bergeyella sp.]
MRSSCRLLVSFRPVLLLYLGTFFLFLSCRKISPEGRIERQEMEISSVKIINAKGKYRIFWVHSRKNLIEIETYKNIYDNLNILVGNDRLDISEEKEVEKVDFYTLTVYSDKYPDCISISDSVEFNISGEMVRKDMHLNMENNAKFIGSLNIDSLKIDMKNGSLANFKGSAKNVFLNIRDTASLIAPYLLIDKINIRARNGIYAEINVKDSLRGSVENSAKLVYYGSPAGRLKKTKYAVVENKSLFDL